MKKRIIINRIESHTYEFTNQCFFGEPVHTYLLELEDKVLLFDIPTYSLEIEKWILSFEKPPVCILSHGPCGISDGSIWQKRIGLKVYLHEKDLKHPWLRMSPDILFSQPPYFAKRIKIIHTPGHSAGSICMLDESTKSLFSGDTFQSDPMGNIIDFRQNTPSRHENIEHRLQSCVSLLNYDFENVFPFHYSILKKRGKESLSRFLYG